MCFEHIRDFNLHDFPTNKSFKDHKLSNFGNQKPKKKTESIQKVEIMALVGKMAKYNHNFCINPKFHDVWGNKCI